MAVTDMLATALNGANIAYLADLYAQWAKDPKSVDPSFDILFGSLGDDEAAVLQDALGASWAPRPSIITGEEAPRPKAAPLVALRRRTAWLLPVWCAPIVITGIWKRHSTRWV